MPVHLKEAIAAIGRGKTVRPRVAAAVAKGLDTPLPSRFQYPSGGRAGQKARRVKIPPSLRIAMLRHTCFKRVVEWAEAWSPAGQLPRGAPEAPAQGAPLRTPETIKEFADMLRDPVGVVRCPFGADFEEHAATASAGPLYRPHKDSLPWWLALVELHGDGYRFGASLDRELPYVFGLVADAVASRRAAREALPGGAPEHTLVVPDDLADALVANAVFRHKVGAYVLVQYALRPEEGLLSEVTQEQLRHGDVMAETSLLPSAAAAGIAAAFFDFALKYRLETALATMSSEHIQVLALFHSQLRRRPVKRVEVSERFDFIQAKPAYVEADAVASPEVPHFALVACDLPGDESGGAAEHSPPRTAVLQAPVICQLCGAGFLSPAGLWEHAKAAHHSWAEYRKRLIFEVQQKMSVPLQPVEKRRLAGNFMQDLLHSYPGRNTVQPGKCTMRQIVACATCAYKDWIDDFYPCYLWKDAEAEAADAAEHAGGEESSDEDREAEGRWCRGPRLRDADNFCYLGPADKIHALLDVELYLPVVPLAPPEELHASSVQHPRFEHMRWLLNTRRVPVLQGTVAGSRTAGEAT